MKLTFIIFSWILFFIPIVAVSKSSNGEIIYGGGKIEVGLDCDKRSSSLSVLYRITNIEKDKNLSLYSKSLNLGVDNPNTFVIIPWALKNDTHRLKYAAIYVKPIDMTSEYISAPKSRFILAPSEQVVIRSLISRFYDINVFERYTVIGFFSFLDYVGDLKYIKFQYDLNPNCFKENDVVWLNNINLLDSKSVSVH